MTKHICSQCGGEIEPPDTGIIDAIGRTIQVTDVLLWLRPEYTICEGALTITSKKPYTFDAVVVIPQHLEANMLDGRYCISATPYQYPDKPVDIRGECGKRNPHIYKIADNICEL